MVWLLVIGGVVAGLVILGMILGSRERKNAPQKLKAARDAWSHGHREQSLGLLAEAFWVSDHYEAADAHVALGVIALLKEILRAGRINPQPLTEKLEAALQSGREVPGELTGEMRKLLDAAAKKPNDLWSAISDALTPFVSLDLDDAGPREIGEISAEESKIINEIGRALVFKSPAEAIQLIDQHLAQARGALRVDLLSQRGGAYAMAGDHSRAAEDYRACVELEPSASVHHRNLAETLIKLGDLARAKQSAVEAAKVARTPKQRADSERFATLILA